MQVKDAQVTWVLLEKESVLVSVSDASLMQERRSVDLALHCYSLSNVTCSVRRDSERRK